MKPIKRIYNQSDNPGAIWNFQWKDDVMKSAILNLRKVPVLVEKTEKDVPLEVFEKLTDELKADLNLLGPWDGRSLVARCAPKITWGVIMDESVELTEIEQEIFDKIKEHYDGQGKPFKKAFLEKVIKMANTNGDGKKRIYRIGGKKPFLVPIEDFFMQTIKEQELDKYPVGD